ncbi:MAG: hypothetical protein KF780_12730 [Sphingomonas sp.]|nr:hypothetical protein [Sphingomonas sp.]
MHGDAVDDALDRLARAPAPVGLSGIEAEIIERLGTERPLRSRDSLGLSAVAALFALTMGVLGGAVPLGSDEAQAALSPLTDGARLAPSTLLMGQR